jgi:hypothetical protein
VSFSERATGSLDAALREATEVGARAARAVDEHMVARILLGALRLGERQSMIVARAVVDGYASEISATHPGLPLRIEWAEPDVKTLPPGVRTRTHLPHHDVGSASFLTYGRVVRFTPDTRVSPKPYSGFFVTAAGDAASLTAFYPLVPALRDAAAHVLRTTEPTLERVTAWYADRLARFEALAPQLRLRYLPLPALLGARDEVFVAVARNIGEKSFSAEELDCYPILANIARRCECGRCSGPVMRLLCRGITSAMGITWPEYRARYERCVSSDQYDMLLWNNVFCQHGGLWGGRGRILTHAYLGLEPGADEEYVEWLEHGWKRQWTRIAGPGRPEALPTA